MVLSGNAIKDGEIIKSATITVYEEDIPFNLKLEDAFIKLCRELKLPVPMWLTKNTKEFACFRITYFSNDQFTDEVYIDRLEVKLDSI